LVGVRTAAIGLVNLIGKAVDSDRAHLTHIRRIFMVAFRAVKRRTQRRQRCKKPRPLTNTRYWIHPRFEVGVYVEDPHALPVQILISRHTDGALSVATSSNSVRVTAVDQQNRDYEPEIYNVARKSNVTAVPDENGEPIAWPNPPTSTSFSPVQFNAGRNHKQRT
jgi:hypothetical protein